MAADRAHILSIRPIPLVGVEGDSAHAREGEHGKPDEGENLEDHGSTFQERVASHPASAPMASARAIQHPANSRHARCRLLMSVPLSSYAGLRRRLRTQ